MPNDTTLRARIHAALASSTPPALDLAAVHYRAENPVRTVKAAPRKGRIAAIALAIAIPAVAFAATPQSLIQATLQHLAIAYFGPKANTTMIHGFSLGRPGATSSTGNSSKDDSVKILVFNKHPVVAMPLAEAVKLASRDFRVFVPVVPESWGKPGYATYVNKMIDYSYSFKPHESVLVTIMKISKESTSSVKSHKFQAFTARFNGHGRLVSSHLMHVVGFALGDESVTFGSPNISTSQLNKIVRAMGGGMRGNPHNGLD